MLTTNWSDSHLIASTTQKVPVTAVYCFRNNRDHIILSARPRVVVVTVVPNYRNTAQPNFVTPFANPEFVLGKMLNSNTRMIVVAEKNQMMRFLNNEEKLISLAGTNLQLCRIAFPVANQ